MGFLAIVGCAPNGPAQASEAVCGASACGAGQIRICGNRCVTPRAANDACDVTLNCAAMTIGVCAGNLVCAPIGSFFSCQDLGSRALSRCGRTPDGGTPDPPCPSGTDCLRISDFNPHLMTGDLAICAGRLAEGQRCSPINDGTATLQCEPGFTCNNGFCRRPCTSSSDCSCATPTSNAACDTAAGFCTRCWSATGRDNNDMPLRCGANSQCCNGLSCNTDGSGACCHAVSTSCTDGTPCCANSQCSSGTCTACSGTNASCTTDSNCCGGTVTNGPRCSGPAGFRICCPRGWARNTAGVCQDFRMDVNNCGAQGTVCPTGTNGTRACTPSPTTGLGVCSFSCSPGYGNCDGDVMTGCEVNLITSTSHCGVCGRVCPTPANGTALCGTDPTNPFLRACDVSCTSPALHCSMRACVIINGSDNSNCGGCGHACLAGASCSAGVCTPNGGSTCSHEIPPNATAGHDCNPDIMGECCWDRNVSPAVSYPCRRDSAGNPFCGRPQ